MKSLFKLSLENFCSNIELNTYLCLKDDLKLPGCISEMIIDEIFNHFYTGEVEFLHFLNKQQIILTKLNINKKMMSKIYCFKDFDKNEIKDLKYTILSNCFKFFNRLLIKCNKV